MPLDSLPVLSILDRVTDADGNPVSGATLEFYLAGTSTPLTVYSDADLGTSLGTTVTCDAGGYPVSGGSTKTMIYVGTSDWKVIVKDASGTTIATHDDMPGADATVVDADTALPSTPVISKTSTYTILTTDQGKLINANPTGGSFALTLPSADSAGDGWRIGIRHNGASTSNVVTVRTTGGETIGAPGQTTTTSISLTGLGQTVWLASDGGDIYTIDGTAEPTMLGGLPFFKIADRLTAPPASPVGGARYIINGTATGAWATLGYDEHDVVESDGNGSWFRYVPSAGSFAYVLDEDLYSSFNGTTWDDQTGMSAPAESALGVLEYSYDGTGTNTIAASTWTTIVHGTLRKNSITGASVASGVITLPTGNYLVMANTAALLPQSTTASIRSRLYSNTSSVIKIGSVNSRNVTVASNNIGVALPLVGFLPVTAATENFVHQWWSSDNGVTLALTDVASTGAADRFATITIIKLDAAQGPAGTQGIQGDDGLDAAYAYQWDTGTTAADPGNGKLRANNATLASATAIYISDTSAAAADLTAVIGSWDQSSSVVKGRLKWSAEDDQSKFAEFFVTSVTDSGDYFTLAVTYVGSGGTITNGADIALLFVDTGDIGDPGVTLPDPSLLVLTNYSSLTSNLKLIAYNPDTAETKVVYVQRGPIDPTNPEFGAVGDGVTDDTAAIQAAIDYAATLAGDYLNLPTWDEFDDGFFVTIDGGGRNYKISSTLGMLTAAYRGIIFQNMKLTASSGGAWSSTVPMFKTDSGARVHMRDVYFECNRVASAILKKGWGALSWFERIVIRHFTDYGIKIEEGSDTRGDFLDIMKWSSADAEHTDPAERTGTGIWVLASDTKFHGVLSRNCGIPIRIGDSATSSDCSTTVWTQCHAWNGVDSGATIRDLVQIRVDEGSTNHTFVGWYLGNGTIDLYDHEVRFLACKWMDTTQAPEQARVRVFATSVGQTAPNNLVIEAEAVPTQTYDGMSVTATTVSGSDIVTMSTTHVGQCAEYNAISGTGIPTGTTIIAIPSTTTVQMSANATANGTITATVKIPLIEFMDNGANTWAAGINNDRIRYPHSISIRQRQNTRAMTQTGTSDAVENFFKSGTGRARISFANGDTTTPPSIGAEGNVMTFGRSTGLDWLVDASGNMLINPSASSDTASDVLHAVGDIRAQNTTWVEVLSENTDGSTTGSGFNATNGANSWLWSHRPASQSNVFRLLYNNGLSIAFDISGNFGLGTTEPDRRMHVEVDNATTNAATQALRLTHTTTGTPATGIGVGLEFEVETAAGNNEVGAIIEAVATDVTSTSEDFDVVIKAMAAGAAAAERVRFLSTGGLSVGTSSPITAGTIELGAASDTTLERASAGDISVEGNIVYRAGGTNVALADGGHGGSTELEAARNLRQWYTPASGASAAAISHTGSTSQTTLVTIPIPANIGANAQIKWELLLGKTGTAGIPTFRFYWGASGAGTGGTFFFSNAPGATNLQMHYAGVIGNRNATNSQITNNANAAGGWGNGTSAPIASTVDTTAASEICITVQLADAADTVRLEAYNVQILPLA